MERKSVVICPGKNFDWVTGEGVVRVSVPVPGEDMKGSGSLE